MDYREFIHPDDEIAMRNLESATGFNMAARYFMENFTQDKHFEQLEQVLTNMISSR